MNEKKGLWETLFGSGCSCGMNIEEDSCCDGKTAKESKKKKGGCCDMQIVEDTDQGNDADNTTQK